MRKSSTIIALNLKPTIFLLSLLLLTIFIQQVYSISSTIIINEFVYNPTGSDLGYEWIELYNKGTENINLNDWKVQIAGTEFKDTLILKDITIQSESYFTICERNILNCSYHVDKIAMQNGGSESDGIRIVDNKGYVIDTVIYDSPNTNMLVNDLNIINQDDLCAPETKEGESLGRKNLIDTNNSYSDFYIFTEPTLGEENTLTDNLENTGPNYLFLLPFLLFIFFDTLGYIKIKQNI